MNIDKIILTDMESILWFPQCQKMFFVDISSSQESCAAFGNESLVSFNLK